MGRLLPAGAALAHTVLQGRAKRADFFGRCVFQRLEKGWLGPHFLSQTLEKGWLAKTAVFQHKVFDCTFQNWKDFVEKMHEDERGVAPPYRDVIERADMMMRIQRSVPRELWGKV